VALSKVVLDVDSGIGNVARVDALLRRLAFLPSGFSGFGAGFGRGSAVSSVDASSTSQTLGELDCSVSVLELVSVLVETGDVGTGRIN
jgi:hypothetical protein